MTDLLSVIRHNVCAGALTAAPGKQLPDQRNQQIVSRRGANIVRISAVIQLLLLISTWSLWWGNSSFPAVPLIAALRDMSVAVDRVLTALFAAAITVLIVWPDVGNSKLSTVANALALAAGVTLCLLNQHRLQPWNVLFLIIIATNLTVDTRQRVTVWRITVAMIYLCAALSRIGPQIDEGISRQILETALDAVGLSRLNRSPSLMWTACVTMTMVEFTAGVFLLTRRLRLIGIILAMAIHATLLLTLSPLGLNHNPGVLIWNAFFLLFLPLLRERGVAVAESGEPSVSQPMPLRTQLVVGSVVILPLSGLFGIADNWPSWQLYSPRPEVLKVYVKADGIDQLPEGVRAYVGEPAPLDDWHPVRIDLWSLAATGAPVYPEDRFQLAVATVLANRIDDPAVIKAILNAPERPLWWKREDLVFASGDEIRQAVEQFRLNAQPQ